VRILSIKLNNFRQFYGETPKITFTYGDRNVVVVHGENGAGKTALLNAFTWTLFNSTTRGFEQEKDIVNKRAIREAGPGKTVEAWVEIEFKYGELHHRIKRAVKATAKSEPPGWDSHDALPPEMSRADEYGKWKSVDDVYDAINKILPQDLHTYFFFDGERIERIMQQSTKEREETGRAAKKMLGVEILVRGEEHLSKAKRELEKEWRNQGDKKIADLIDKKQILENDHAALENRQKEIRENVDAHKEICKRNEERLRNDKESQAIQQRRDRLKKDRDDRAESYKKQGQLLAETISKQGYLLFSEEVVNNFCNIIDDLVKRGEIPSGIKRNFVDNLLKVKSCICETKLIYGSDARKAVEGWKDKAGLADVEQKAIRMGGEITQTRQQMPQVSESIDQIQQRRATDHKELSRIEEELEKISDLLKKNPPREDIKLLQTEIDKAEDSIKELWKEQGANELKIKNANNQIKELEKDIEKMKGAEAKQALSSRRVKAAQEAASRIDSIRELMETDFRKSLEEKITELFRTISPTPYIPKLGDDYSLGLIESAGGDASPVGKSTGESQILSLCFIGSIIELVRQKQAKETVLPGPETSSYPIIMDSPFGTLSMYRHQIAEHMPALADQIGLFVSPGQWKGDVESSIEQKLGKSYVLTYYTPRTDIKEVTIILDGKNYDLVKISPNDFEYTLVQEVSS
jgi:DNA sulfur modification protein DndD